MYRNVNGYVYHTLEIVLILVILIGLVLVFKEQITTIVNNAFAGIAGDAGQILK